MAGQSAGCMNHVLPHVLVQPGESFCRGIAWFLRLWFSARQKIISEPVPGLGLKRGNPENGLWPSLNIAGPGREEAARRPPRVPGFPDEAASQMAVAAPVSSVGRAAHL